MGISINLTNVSNLTDTTTAQGVMSGNNATITTAFTSALNTSGDTMQGVLDMNSNQIINLPAPLTNNSPARLQDLSTISSGGTVSNIPVGGSTNQVLTKNSNTNFDISWKSASLPVAGTGITVSSATVSITPTAVSSGSYGSASQVATFTVNSQGQLTAATNVSVVAPAGGLTGTTLAVTVSTSSLTSLSTITTGTWQGTAIATAYRTPVNLASTANGGVVGILSMANGGTNATSGAVIHANIQMFATAGTSIYSPTSGLLYAILECVGGGGGGGGAVATSGQIFGGGGGGGGAYTRTYASASTINATTYTVTVGVGGIGGTAGANNGTAGGISSIGSLISANGGSGGKFGSSGQLGIGGAGGSPSTTGTVLAGGGVGGSGIYWIAGTSGATVSFPSGNGGSSIFGGGATGLSSVSAANGMNGTNYGGGGSAGYSNSTSAGAAGGTGSPGIVIITEFLNV